MSVFGLRLCRWGVGLDRGLEGWGGVVLCLCEPGSYV